MKAMIAAAVLALLAAPVLVHAQGHAPIQLKSVTVDLPTSEQSFPPGPDVQVVQNNCLTCHSAGMVLTQPHMSRASWEAEVKKMIAVYGAPVPANAVPQITDYLASIKGTETSK